jgi:DNA mismatch repair protein MutL
VVDVPIARLPPSVAARIAAGEVVERPASVVKELLENALDAGARRVRVEIEGGGIDLIRVVDDGRGIEVDELPLAFERHATSKLASDADLDRIETLGFRGEALPSIIAVADLDCLTRSTTSPHAYERRYRAGRAGPSQPTTRAVGTTMTVRSLFAELPARRKFLRGRGSEAGQIATIVSQMALAFPEVGFSLTIDGRRTLETHGECLLAAIEAVHGRAVAAAMLPIATDDGNDAELRIEGFLGTGAVSMPTRGGLTLLVNRRWVQNRSLSYAVDEAYRTLLPIGRHPVAVLDVRLPPAEVDVNVHPRKVEVRLLNERSVFGAVQRAVRTTLGDHAGPRPASFLASDGESELPPDEGWTRGLRTLGQAGGLYIIAEGSAGIYLVDQHAAHERVLYERLRDRSAPDQASQALLAPAVLELGSGETAVALEQTQTIRALGYDVEAFGERALLVRGVPAPLAARDPLGTLKGALAELGSEAPPTDWHERLAILFACHNAVRAGDRLSPEEMSALLDQLGEAELCQACSHGRPTAILLSHNQLAREFGRNH